MSALLALCAALAALAAARPHADVPRMELADVVGRTVCPLQVTVDEDPLRLPRRIKFISCEREGLRQCARRAAGAPACCARTRLDAATHCVEVYDSVAVRFVGGAGNATRQVVQVPVGCACVLRAPALALDDG